MKFKTSKNIVVTILRWIGRIIAVLLSLLIVFILCLRIPSIQNKITQRAISFLKEKIKTDVRLESLYVSFPKQIVLKGLYLEDQSNDTLLYAGQISVDTDLWALLQNKIELNSVELSDCKAQVKRSKTDSLFNFSYIVEAFAGDTAEADVDTTSSWQFSLEEVEITQADLTYHDQYSGNDVQGKIGELNLDMNEFDLNKMIFEIGSLEIINTNAIVSQTVPGTPQIETNTPVVIPDISFNTIDFQVVKFQYLNSETKQNIRADIQAFKIEANEIDLNKKKIDLDVVELKNSSISYQQEKTKAPKEEISEQQTTFTGINIPWNITVNEIQLTGNNLQYDDFNFEPTKASIDFNHLFVSNLQLSAEEIEAKDRTAKANLEKLSFQEKSGFTLQSLIANVELTENQFNINQLEIHSGQSKIKMAGKATLASFVEFEKTIIDFDIKPSNIVLKDILFFSPTLLDSVPLKLPEETSLSFEGNLDGTLQNLTISNLNLKTLNNTTLALEGNIKGLREFKTAMMNVNLKHFRTTAYEIHSIVVDSLIPASIQIPEQIQLSGNYHGTIEHSTIKAQLVSSSGNLQTEGKFGFTSVPTYDAVLKTDHLQLGKILKQPETMGALTMSASMKGSGLSMDTINSLLNITVQSFQYNQYEYKDFNLEGKLNKYLFSGTASLHDENLDFTLTGDLDYQQEIPLYKFTLALTNANFQKLNLSERPLKARGTLDLNLATSDFKVINGDLAIRKVAIYNGQSLYMVDSLLFASIDQQGESSMTIQSDILSGEFKGTFNLFSIAGVMRQHLNQYFSLQDEAITDFKTPQQFKFDLTLRNTDLITEILIPDLEPFIPGKIKGEFDSEKNILNIEIGISKIKYATTTIDSLSAFIHSDDESLRYKFRVKNVKLDTLTIDAAQLTGKIENDSILSSFQILNSKDEEKYILGGVIRSQEKNFRFHFLPDQVLLNYTKWNAPPDNYLEFNNQGMVAHNFSIASGQEKIALVTTVKDSTLSIEFDQLQLSSLTRIVRGVMPANGQLNGNFKLTTASRGNFNSKLAISNLEVLEKPIGDLTLALSHTGNRYVINMQIKNEGSNILAEGYYASDENTSDFNLTATLAPLNLQLVEALSFGQIKNAKGFAEGTLKLTGNFKQPSIRGRVTFKDASFKSTYLNSTFALVNETISFEESGIAFNDFTIRDSKKNEATIRGNILTRTYKEFRFNLKLSAKNFQLLNTTEDDNKLYYGKVRINTQATISGSSNRPRIDMNVSFSDDTEFTYIVPQSQKNVMEQKGIVQFVDKDARNDPFLAEVTAIDTVVSSFVGINLSANLELNDEETLNIVIDPATGDKLSVKGNSSLTFDMDASGNMNLAGRYEISEGSYELSFYKLVKRKFDIEKGSTIIWAGNPLNATLDIRAKHRVETSPIDLISNQINTTDQTQLNMYRQRLPFLVYLDIDGQLLAPQISFKLDMPVDKQSAFGGAIYAKIIDINTRESDVNKQVFALLILKRFVSDNPLESQGGSDIANTTRTSASRILSDQLNRLSENVKGIQLSFDIKSYQDYSTGQAQGDTQVQLGVSKSLFNDRLVVKLSGNVDVEGENTQQESAADYIGDLALEYKLTGDGRFRITGFRTSNYDMIDGELIETGAGLIYIKDYNTLRELFKPNAKQK